MPCYQVNTVSVDFQAGDLALLQKAAASLSLVVVDDGSGRVIRDRNGTVATLRNNVAVCRLTTIPTTMGTSTTSISIDRRPALDAMEHSSLEPPKGRPLWSG
jgi:hypothetical protein